ncbi:MAG: response regulator [Bacteroidota bacterium]
MSTEKVHTYPFSESSKPRRRFENIVLIDDDTVDLFINETILRAAGISKNVKVISNPADFINQLVNTERLSDVPELIFLNLQMSGLQNFDFMSEFSTLSDFIRNKCKIVVITAQPIVKLLSNTSIVRYLQKPLDVFQLKEFLP